MEKEIKTKVNVVKVWELDKWYQKAFYVLGYVSAIWLMFWFCVGFIIGLVGI